jgi:hypothetical protein
VLCEYLYEGTHQVKQKIIYFYIDNGVLHLYMYANVQIIWRMEHDKMVQR